MATDADIDIRYCFIPFSVSTNQSEEIKTPPTDINRRKTDIIIIADYFHIYTIVSAIRQVWLLKPDIPGHLCHTFIYSGIVAIDEEQHSEWLAG